MKKLFYLIFFIPFLLPAAETDPLSFFPYKAVGYWEYKIFSYSKEITAVSLSKDQLDSLGNRYVNVLGRNYKVQPNGEVHALNFGPGLEYKLTAQEGEFWWKKPNGEFPFYKGRMNRRYSTLIFGKIRDVLEIMICDVGDTTQKPEPDCFANGHIHTLVSGIGIVQTRNVEDGSLEWILQGAIINGDTIGTLRPVGVEEIPHSSYPETVYPNPAADLITIPFTLPKDEQVEISLYNTLGEKTPLFSEAKEAGQHETILNIAGVSSGFYICEVRTNTNNHHQIIEVKR